MLIRCQVNLTWILSVLRIIVKSKLFILIERVKIKYKVIETLHLFIQTFQVLVFGDSYVSSYRLVEVKHLLLQLMIVSECSGLVEVNDTLIVFMDIQSAIEMIKTLFHVL